jgi:hypothetical protein
MTSPTNKTLHILQIAIHYLCTQIKKPAAGFPSTGPGVRCNTSQIFLLLLLYPSIRQSSPRKPYSLRYFFFSNTMYHFSGRKTLLQCSLKNLPPENRRQALECDAILIEYFYSYRHIYHIGRFGRCSCVVLRTARHSPLRISRSSPLRVIGGTRVRMSNRPSDIPVVLSVPEELSEKLQRNYL